MPTTAPTCGGHLVTADGRTLPLRETRLVARAAGGFATTRVVQTFTNPFAEVLQLRYLLPLPADAAVAGFAFVIGERRVRGEIERRAAARERFERALVEGRTAGLLEQERAALFAQELGNVPPGATIVAEIDVDQPLAWTDGGWEWRFPVTVAPRYVGSEGRVPDAGRIEVPVAEHALAARLHVELQVADALVPGSAIRSPSHPLRGAATNGGAAVHIAEAPLDRDVVVRWQVAAPEVGLGLRVARPTAGSQHAHEAYGLLTLVPPAAGAVHKLARDLIVLLDISGSMQGQPLAAAVAVTSELVRSLDAGDRLELIAFASQPHAWLGAPCFATEANKAAALQWLASLRASGGTEMRDAIVAALQPLREAAQRQVVLVTDGQIGFEAEIVGEIRNRLPASSRVHVVGVGSAPNRSLTKGASRAGRGLEVLVGITEDPAPAAQRLLARTAAPLVTGLTIGGSAVLGTCPQALPDLFAGAPARLGLRLRPEGGTLVVRGIAAGGAFHHEVPVAHIAAGDGEAMLPRIVAREWVEDLEAAIAAEGELASHGERIERIGLSFAIATRATSWLAIDESANVDPRATRRVVEVPHELPHGMSMQGLGLRAASGSRAFAESLHLSCDSAIAAGPPAAMPAPAAPASPPSPTKRAKRGFFDGLFGKQDGGKAAESVRREAPAPLAVLRSRTGDEWVFDIQGLARWHMPTRVVMVFADGAMVTVDVVVESTTRDGAFAAGIVVRLVVRGGAHLPALRPTQLRLGEGADAPVVPAA